MAGAAGAAGVAAAGAGYAVVRALGSDPAPAAGSFRSRPDLSPQPVEVVARTPEASTGSILLTPSAGPGRPGPLIADGERSPVWVNPRPDLVTANLRVQSYLELPALTWWEGRQSEGLSDGEWVVVDQTYTEVARVRAGNGHRTALDDLVITPWHTALVLASAPVAGGPVVESVVQEVDIATGAVRFEWHSHDHVAVESRSPPPGARAARLLPRHVGRPRRRGQRARVGPQHVGDLPRRQSDR